MATEELTKITTSNRAVAAFPFSTELEFKEDTASEAFSAVCFVPFFPY